MGIGTISLNIKRALILAGALAFLATLLAFPASVGATTPPPPLGKLTVYKAVDKNGDGDFGLDSTGGNALGFRWMLNGGSERLMGDAGKIEGLTLGQEYSISEKMVKGYIFAGWYDKEVYRADCNDNSAYPVKVTPTENNKIREIVLCNKRVGTITVTKQTNPHNDPQSFSLTASSSDGGKVYGDATTSIKDNGSVVFHVKPGYTYSVTETVPAGWTMNSNTCSNLEVGSKPVIGPLSRVGPPAPANLDKECEIDNTKNATPVVLGIQTPQPQVVAAPVGGVGAGSGSSGANLGALLGLAGSLGAVGFGLRSARKMQ